MNTISLPHEYYFVAPRILFRCLMKIYSLNFDEISFRAWAVNSYDINFFRTIRTIYKRHDILFFKYR